MSDGKNSILCYIRIDQDYVATISVKETEKPLTKGDCLIVKIVCDAIRQAVLFEEKNHLRLTLLSTTAAMQSLLGGDLENDAVDTINFSVKDRNILKPWLLVGIRDLKNQTSVARQWLSNELRHFTTPNISSPYKSEIIVLISEADRTAFFSELEIRTRTNSNSIGISLPLYDLYEIPVKYNQAIFALEQCNGMAYALDARELIFPFLLHQLRCFNNDLGFTHPVIEKLKNYDTEKETDLYKTLITFLNNERVLAKTADQLFIHRNTLANRIEKIREITNADLEDPMERLYIILSSLI